MPVPRMLLILSENWTMTPGRDLPELIRWAREAEDAGFDAVMVSEHVVLGPDASDRGVMANPRMYALPGNQDPLTPWPTSVVLLSVGRLVVQPTVSWSRDEYAAPGVPFGQRGAILDEQLEVMALLWRRSPVSYHGEFFRFSGVSFEPKAFRPDGPRLWFGGQRVHGPVLDRLVRYRHGFHPLGAPGGGDLARLRSGLAAAGRDIGGLELVRGGPGRFPDNSSCADLGQAMAAIPAQQAAGFTTFGLKPSQFIDDPARIGWFCREVIRHAGAMGAGPG